MLEKLCKELGVELGEEWEGNNGVTYIIEEEAIIEYYEPDESSETDYDSWIMSGYEVYADILQGKLKPVWKPKKGEKYYIPSLFPKRFDWYCWGDDNDEFDTWFFNNNMIFKTKKEAIATANKMIKALKEED